MLLYLSGSRSSNDAASPFNGSSGLGYRRSCGRNMSNTFTRSNIGLQVWLITSRHTDPDRSSTLGWYMRFRNPMDGDLNG